MLPPPENNYNEKNLERSKLMITAHLQEWKLERVGRFIDLLGDLEKELPPSIPQTINYIERGSIIIELWGGFKSLVAMVHSIADLKNTTIDGKLKEMELKKKALELKKEKIDLKYYAKAKDLENKKAETELMQMNLALIDTLEKKTGFNFREYWESSEGERAKAIGKKIQLEFPIIDIRIEE
ncbi:MAG: hypothetical protein JWQ09_302 [Segetibacter sp.]|nr:hypothetical protein [Segetibacter sp.]